MEDIINANNPGTIDNPEFSQDGQIENRSVRGPSMALAIARALEQANIPRNLRNAKIIAKYDGEPPHDAKRLQSTGQDWKSNFCTGFMSGIVDRVLPSFFDVVQQSRHLTNSKLPNENPLSSEKSDKFRAVTTRVIREWHGWRDSMYALTQENVLIGYAAAAFPDPYDWRPQVFRQDQFYVPDGSTHHVQDLQVLVLKRSFLIHELLNFIRFPEAAELAGWNVENVKKSLEQATPQNPLVDGTTNYRAYEDIVREGSLGTSYLNGAKTIEVFDVYAREFSGKVSHFMIDRLHNTNLFARYDEFEDMSDVVCLFSLQNGNGKLHSSKGLGRILFNFHVAVERMRNALADQIYMSGLLCIQGDAKAREKAAVTVKAPFFFISKDFEVGAASIPANTTPFFEFDRQITAYAEQSVGAFIPAQNLMGGQSSKTATEATIVAQKEEQVKKGILGRFYGQLGSLVSTIQRRIYSEDNIIEASKRFDREQTGIRAVTRKVFDFLAKIGKDMFGIEPKEESAVFDEAAVGACLELLKSGLSAEEIFELANTPALEVTTDGVAQQNAEIVAVSRDYAMNPLIDQKELTRKALTARLGAETADALIIKDDKGDIEAARSQNTEVADMITLGQPIPVSPRDNHRMHLEVLKQLLMQAPQAQDPKVIAAVPLALQHAQEHIDMAIQSGEPKDNFTQDIEFLKQFTAAVAQPAPVQQGAPAPQAVPAQAPQMPAM